jgi:CheY-like chemotaxis protein
MTGEMLKVLLIEDNAGDVYLFREALRRAQLSFELTVLADGGEAMRFVQRHGKYAESPRPNVAIMDLNLPMNDGVEILEAIRNSQHLATLPVVITSSFVCPADRLKIERLGVARCVDKPSDPEQFFEIGSLLRQILVEEALP